MEVHAHTHTPRKKWTHYFWEFLMLFLAVFCGFLAENQREHLVEHSREKQYIRSLVEDIKTDTSNCMQWAGLYSKLRLQCDSIIMNFPGFIRNNSSAAALNFSALIHGFPDFIYTDQTIQQLKNAGGLRLIRKRNATDSIIAYDAAARDMLIEETVITFYYDQLNTMANKMLSYRKMNENGLFFRQEDTIKVKINNWIINDLITTEQLYNLVFKYGEEINGYIRDLNKFKSRGSRLIAFLKKEYHLK